MKFFVASLLVVVAALPAIARADDSSEATKVEAQHQAESLVGQGAALFNRGDFAGALARFQSAYDTYPSHKIFFNIAEAQRRLGHQVEAVNAYECFLALTQDAPDIHTQRISAQKHLKEMRRGLAVLQISVTPPEAAVEVDGERVPWLEVYVKPGIHHVQASADGYVSANRDVTVLADDSHPMPFVLEHVPAVAATPQIAPPTTAAAPAPSKPLAPEVLAPAPAPSHAAAWTLIGVGGAALVTSAVFGALAAHDNSQLHDEVLGGKSDLSDADVADLRGSVKTDGWVSTATLGAGIVSAGIGVFLLLHGHPAQVQPTAAAGEPAVSFNF